MATGSDAISRSAEDTARQFQVYLRKYENDDRLVIVKAVDKPGSKLGDNYTSLMIRTEITGTRGDGSPYSKVFMSKILAQRPAASLLDLHYLFRIETHVYKNILPNLGPFGPRCVFTDHETIIMEDLAVKGYSYCDRRNFLDLEHTVFALKKLAQLHATALAMKIKEPQVFDEMVDSLKEVVYKDIDGDTPLKACTDMCMKVTINQLKAIESRTPELQNVLDHTIGYVDRSYDTMHDMFNMPKRKYDTICHGDPWNNNLLFLHDDNGDIVDLKMVDYQICRYTSVSTDVHYLMYTSAKSSLIENSYDSLIASYHDELIDELRRKHVDELTLADLGMDWLREELKIHAFYGLLTGCFLVHPMLADEADVQKFEEISSDTDNTKTFISTMSEMALNQNKLERVKCVALHYYRKYIAPSGLSNGSNTEETV